MTSPASTQSLLDPATDATHHLDVDRGTGVASATPRKGAEMGGPPSKPSKEYRARIWVKLSDDFLPHPLLSKAELEARLTEALGVGTDDSPVASVRVDDPR
ncbi:MAG: hypothetical protein P1T08_09990 [Acidimicrobiia bacterium]|nr:hypothetical protein [Acidimicrobiia bacterium]